MFNQRWYENSKLMAELWPEWEPTEETVKLWRETFGNLNHEWVARAIRQVRLNYSSRSPEIKWVREAFEAVRAGESVHSPAKRAAMAQEQRMKMQSEVERDREAILNALLNLPPDILANAKQRARLLMLKWPDADDPREWSATVRGIVHAEAEYLMERVA